MMAVTSIWPVRGRVDHVIDYARNPEKTTERSLDEQAALHMIDGVVEYAADGMKTERRAYVTCLNCREDTAAAQFVETKRLWKKRDGRMCYHGYQSFRAGEVTAETAHEIGVRLAQELWGDRFEVVVATHLNTGHYHNHYVINSVSFADGRKFYNSRADYARMRQVSDRLCREYALSVVEQTAGRTKSYAEWMTDQNDRPTRRSGIRADIDRAILASTTERDFIRVMTEMGYLFKLCGESGAPLKYPGLKPPDAKGYFRFHKLGDGYAPEQIRERILENIRKRPSFPEAEQGAPRHYRLRGGPPKKLTGLRALYYRYCYELHILVKRPASVKRVSFLLREDVTRLHRLDEETRLLGRYRIGDIDGLIARREQIAAEIETLTARRQLLRGQLRGLSRQGQTQDAQAVKAQIADISRRLGTMRKEMVLCDGIAERSGQVKANLEWLLEEKAYERKEMNQNELCRGRGRTGRTYDVGRQ